MSDSMRHDRKSFLKKLGAASALITGAPLIMSQGRSQAMPLSRPKGAPVHLSANDRVNLGLIGAGGMGQGNINTALNYDGFRLVAACDLYDSRLERCRERYGRDIFITRDYRELLDRSDVDAVVIGTSDHWHDQIAIEAMEKGKAVYLEKPITQHVDEAYNVIDAEERTGVPLIVGSQRTSHIAYEKARDLYSAGEIGTLNFVEGYWDRFSAQGAWQYSIPPSASEANIDWKTYRKDLPSIPFDAKHFFRWRNYDDYGTGVAGDLFVHLFSGMHMILDSAGPEQIYATGGLRYWHDGRDAEDMVLGLFDYPETDTHPAFNLALRVNFADGSGGGSMIRLVGTEGEMQIRGSSVILRRSKMPEAPGMSISSFSEDVREEYQAYYREMYPETRASMIEPTELIFRAPDGYSDRYDHFVNFYKAIRNGEPLLQNSTFGLRAAGPALMANRSLKEGGQVIRWDPSAMRAV